MNPFESIVVDVITHYKEKLKLYNVASNRMQMLTSMHNEIVQLKKTFLELYPQQEQVFDDFVNDVNKLIK